MGNQFIFGLLEIRVPDQITHFLKPHPKPCFEREKERKKKKTKKPKGQQARVLILSHCDFGVVCLEAIQEAFC